MQAQSPDVVTARDLTVGYGERLAVRQVSVALHAGEIVGLLGLSGSGKSTLGRVLMGKPPRGACVQAGTVERRGTAALIPQEPSLTLNPYMRAGDQVRHCSPAASTEEVVELFGRLGLENADELFRRYPHQLSGGQQQRVVWAQALIRRPDFLVADEPTAAVDSILQREITEAVRGVVAASGCAVVWIAHDPQLLAAVCERLLVMHDGRIVEDDLAGKVVSNPESAITRRLLEVML